MSACLVSPQHIHALVAYAIHAKVIHRDDGAELARTLASENIRSVEYRYPDTEGQAAPSFLPAFDSNDEYLDACARPWEEPETRVAFMGVVVKGQAILAIRPPMDIIKLCHGYEYQSCEHPGWKTSDACDYLRMIEKTACRDLPDYDDAPWSV